MRVPVHVINGRAQPRQRLIVQAVHLHQVSLVHALSLLRHTIRVHVPMATEEQFTLILALVLAQEAVFLLFDSQFGRFCFFTLIHACDGLSIRDSHRVYQTVRFSGCLSHWSLLVRRLGRL